MVGEGKSRGGRSLLLTARALFAGAVFDILAFIALLTTALFMSFKVLPLPPLPHHTFKPLPTGLAISFPLPTFPIARRNCWARKRL